MALWRPRIPLRCIQATLLVGDLARAYSRRVNVQLRLVYQVLEQDRVVKVIRI